MNLLQRINPNRIPDSVKAEGELAILRERILQYILIGASIAGLITIVATLFRYIPEGNWGIAIIYSLLYLAALSITILRDLSYRLKSFMILALVFAVGLTDLLEYGMSGEGRIALVSFVIVGAGLLNTERGAQKYLGWFFLAATALFLTGFGFLMSNGIIPLPPVEKMATSGRFGDWINGNLVFLLMTTLSVSLVIILTTGLNNALEAQKTLTHALEEERNSLERRVEDRTQQLERRAIEMEAASTLARDISSMSSLEELLSTAVSLVQNEFDFYHVGLFLLDDRSEYAVLKSATGEAGRIMLENNHRLRVGEVGIVGYVVSKGEPRIALNVGEDAFHFKNPILPLTQSEMALPLITDNRVIGALDVQSKKQNAFTQQDILVLQTIADQLAVAIEKAELVTRLQKSLQDLERNYQQFTQKSWKTRLSAPKHRYGYRYKDSIIEQRALDNEQALAVLQSGDRIVAQKTIESTGQITTEVSIPIKLRSTTLGVMNIQFDSEKVSSNLIQMLETSAERLAIALDNARMLEEIQSQAERSRMITEIAGRVRSSSNIDEILRTAAEELGQTIGISEVIVQLSNPKNGVKLS